MRGPDAVAGAACDGAGTGTGWAELAGDAEFRRKASGNGCGVEAKCQPATAIAQTRAPPEAATGAQTPDLTIILFPRQSCAARREANGWSGVLFPLDRSFSTAVAP